MGSQADNLFYLDPHNARPAIPLRPPPVDVEAESDVRERREIGIGSISDSEREQDFAPPRQLHYCTAYSAAELKTFHCERVRKMPMSGLDPSMLIGFLCRDEKDWWDFKERVADVCSLFFLYLKADLTMSSLQLPRTIFSVQDEMPTWPSDSDDSIGLESISEPDDMNLDDDEVNDDDAAVGVVGDEAEEEEEEEGEVVEFDDEGAGEEEKDVDDYRSFEDDEDNGSGDDIEDDWIDPSLPSPPSTSRPGPRPLPKPLQQPQPLPPPVPRKDHGSPSVSSLSSSSSPPMLASKSKSSSSKQSSSTSNHSVKVKSKKQTPVPVPQVRLLAQQQQPQEQHYPFPVAPVDDPWVSSPQHRVASSQDRSGGGASNGQGNQHNFAEIEKRMHTARARDGGRTQSGGVKGILPEG